MNRMLFVLAAAVTAFLGRQLLEAQAAGAPPAPPVVVEGLVFDVPSYASRSLPQSGVRSRVAVDPFLALSALTGFKVVPATRLLSREADNRPGSKRSEFSNVGTLSGDLDAALSTLETNGEVRVLQRPLIVTAGGGPMSIHVTPPVYDPTYQGAGDGSIKPRQAGVVLMTTCSLAPNGLVLMDIQQEVTTVTGRVTIPNVGAVPATTTRRSRAHVAVRDGQTIVLAGLVENVRTPVFSEVALLERVPRVGSFLNRLITYPTRKTPHEVLILIRPTVPTAAQAAAWPPNAVSAKMPVLGPSEEELQAGALKRLRAAEADLNPSKTLYNPAPAR